MPAVAQPVRRSEPKPTVPSGFAADVRAGLTSTPKRLPAKYFYDAAGSLLFERITELPEYYPTRCELQILRAHAGDLFGELLPDGIDESCWPVADHELRWPFVVRHVAKMLLPRRRQ